MQYRGMTRKSSRFSAAIYPMLTAISDSVSLEGSVTAPNVASASVMLCATVNDVITFTSDPSVVVATSSPIRNARWS